jgi:DNA polymerase (family X)
MSLTKSYLPLAKARALADKVVTALTPHCQRIAIAGSIRREKMTCGDIDLVAQGITPVGIERLCENTTVLSRGDKNISVVLANGFGIQLFIADTPASDLFGNPLSHDTWGTLLLCRTGCMQHNIFLASRAVSRGMHWNPYKGILKHGKLIAHATEEDIYKALDLTYIEPQNRTYQTLISQISNP